MHRDSFPFFSLCPQRTLRTLLIFRQLRGTHNWAYFLYFALSRPNFWRQTLRKTLTFFSWPFIFFSLSLALYGCLDTLTSRTTVELFCNFLFYRADRSLSGAHFAWIIGWPLIFHPVPAFLVQQQKMLSGFPYLVRFFSSQCSSRKQQGCRTETSIYRFFKAPKAYKILQANILEAMGLNAKKSRAPRYLACYDY